MLSLSILHLFSYPLYVEKKGDVKKAFLILCCVNLSQMLKTVHRIEVRSGLAEGEGMRLGAKRHIYFRTNRGGRKKISGFLLFLLVLSLLFAGGAYFVKVMRPLMAGLAENQSHIAAEQAIHRVAEDLFADSRYTDFITLTRAEDGTVSAAETNVQSVNRLKAAAAVQIQEQLSALGETTIGVPLGSTTGIGLLTGLGPYLPVRILPYGNILVDFKSTFTAAGINQTHLEISLHAKASIGTVMPTVTAADTVETEIPVVQTVIVGKVPESYINIDRMGEAYEGDVMDLLSR